jgi:hypothetical protein
MSATFVSAPWPSLRQWPKLVLYSFARNFPPIQLFAHDHPQHNIELPSSAYVMSSRLKPTTKAKTATSSGREAQSTEKQVSVTQTAMHSASGRERQPTQKQVDLGGWFYTF